MGSPSVGSFTKPSTPGGKGPSGPREESRAPTKRGGEPDDRTHQSSICGKRKHCQHRDRVLCQKHLEGLLLAAPFSRPHSRVSDSGVLGGARELVDLTGAQVLLLLHSLW